MHSHLSGAGAAEFRGYRPRNLAEARIREVENRVGIICPIENIGERAVQLDVHAFLDNELFGESHGSIERAGALQDADARIAEATDGSFTVPTKAPKMDCA